MLWSWHCHCNSSSFREKKSKKFHHLNTNAIYLNCLRKWHILFFQIPQNIFLSHQWALWAMTVVSLQNSLQNVSQHWINYSLRMFFRVNTYWIIAVLQLTVYLHSPQNSESAPTDFCLIYNMTKGLLFEDLVLKIPEGMTFPHCHQLHEGFIKYRLCVILVLAWLRLVAWEVCVEVVGKTQRGS